MGGLEHCCTYTLISFFWKILAHHLFTQNRNGRYSMVFCYRNKSHCIPDKNPLCSHNCLGSMYILLNIAQIYLYLIYAIWSYHPYVYTILNPHTFQTLSSFVTQEPYVPTNESWHPCIPKRSLYALSLSFQCRSYNKFCTFTLYYFS